MNTGRYKTSGRLGNEVEDLKRKWKPSIGTGTSAGIACAEVGVHGRYPGLSEMMKPGQQILNVVCAMRERRSVMPEYCCKARRIEVINSRASPK